MAASEDSWDAQMNLWDKWAESGGYSNKRFAMPFLRKAEAMKTRLQAAGVPHPLFTEVKT